MSIFKDILRAVKEFWDSIDKPDQPPGALMVLRVREVLIPHPLEYGRLVMKVELDVGIPLLTEHERGQGVTTRNFLAVKNGDSQNPLLALTGQPAESFTQVTLTPLQYGDKVELKLYNVDQAGNVSASPLDGSMVLVDTVPPDGPIGSFSYQLREVADDPAPPAEPPAEPPVSEPVVESPPSG